MERIRAIASALTGVVVMMSAVWPAVAADGEPSATITMTHDSSGIGIGWHSGEGKLTLKDGSEFAFTLDGYGIVGIGFANVTSTGKVYNLEKASDLSGEYIGTGESAVFGHGEGKAILKNKANNVRIEVVSSASGVRAGIGIGSVTFKLGKRLKGPDMPPPVATAPSPPPVKVAPLPTVTQKPTEYTLPFGFNKSRVNLAMQRVLDSIIAHWKGKAAAFRIVGHADMVGSEKYNLTLSQRRADAVKRAMVERGVPASLVTAVGVGQKQLAVTTKRGQRLRANRRVVPTVLTKNNW